MEQSGSSPEAAWAWHRGRRGRQRPSPLRIAFTGLLVILFLASLVPPAAATLGSEDEDLLDPMSIPKWVNQLTGPPPVYEPTVRRGGKEIAYTVDMTAFSQQILPPGFPETPVWGYGGTARDAITGEALGYVRNAPGPSFESLKDVPITVKWVNEIDSAHLFPVDPTLHWADPNDFGMPMDPYPEYPPGFPEAQSPVPLVAHLHGGEVPSASDGGPNAWFTWDGIHGPGYSTYRRTDANAAVYWYPNSQPAATLWYHDHGLGITRINVMSGLAGFYVLRDPHDPIAPLLPSGRFEMPLVIQDRSFYANGAFFYGAEGVNPDIHPYWMPEFFGDVIMVNGLVWPNLDVAQGQYRFRLLDGSNARFYTLSFLDQSSGTRLPFLQIGTDGGYLRAAAPLTELTIAPGERADLLVDFSGLAPGTKVVVTNRAKAPFPRGEPANPQTTGQILQFTVTAEPGAAPATLPTILNPALEAFPSLPAPTKTRILTLVELEGAEGPLGALLNGQMWDAPISEYPVAGTTEDWIVVNPTADTHPIHLHLVQFQLVYRQRVRAAAYLDDWMDLNGMPPFDFTPTELPVAPYLIGGRWGPAANEQGWKDTLQMHPGQVTVIRVRFAPVDGSPAYSFDVTQGPGYVWHCHILEHEDNEMMRPYEVVSP